MTRQVLQRNTPAPRKNTLAKITPVKVILLVRAKNILQVTLAVTARSTLVENTVGVTATGSTVAVRITVRSIIAVAAVAAGNAPPAAVPPKKRPPLITKISMKDPAALDHLAPGIILVDQEITLRAVLEATIPVDPGNIQAALEIILLAVRVIMDSPVGPEIIRAVVVTTLRAVLEITLRAVHVITLRAVLETSLHENIRRVTENKLHLATATRSEVAVEEEKTSVIYMIKMANFLMLCQRSVR